MGTFLNSIRWSLFAGQLVAFVFFSMNENGNKQTFVWCLPFLVAFFVCTVKGLSYIYILLRYDKQVVQLGDLLFLVTSILSLVSTVFYFFVRRNKFRRVLAKIDDFNDVLRRETTSTRKHLELVVFVSNLAFFVAIDVFLMHASGISLFFYFWIAIGIFVTFVQQFLIHQVVGEIASQMFVLNRKLRWLVKEKKSSVAFERQRRSDPIETAREILILRGTVSEIALETNIFFGFPIWVAFGQILVILICTCYFITHFIVVERSVELLSHILWSVYFFIEAYYSLKCWTTVKSEVSQL